MGYINLTDGSGKRFDPAAATKFSEDTHWNGQNHISVNTGSPWDHETLYRTKSGVWVLNYWSQWQGSLPNYVQITDAEAYAWLVRNDHAEEVPQSYLDTVTI